MLNGMCVSVFCYHCVHQYIAILYDPYAGEREREEARKCSNEIAIFMARKCLTDPVQLDSSSGE